jgi:hypothetical protein
MAAWHSQVVSKVPPVPANQSMMTLGSAHCTNSYLKTIPGPAALPRSEEKRSKIINVLS